MKRKFWTASNLLSISRGVLSIPFVWVMLSGRSDARFWGAVIIGLGILTDKFDGVLARRLHQETEWGKILDPLADKVGVASVALVLFWLNDIPLWFVTALLTRDLVIFAGGIVIRQKRGHVLASNQAGKWTIGVVSATMLLALLGVDRAFVAPALAVSAVMLAVSFALYVKRFYDVMHTPG